MVCCRKNMTNSCDTRYEVQNYKNIPMVRGEKDCYDAKGLEINCLPQFILEAP